MLILLRKMEKVNRTTFFIFKKIDKNFISSSYFCKITNNYNNNKLTIITITFTIQ